LLGSVEIPNIEDSRTTRHYFISFEGVSCLRLKGTMKMDSGQSCEI